jgi:hypothetical protein
MKICFGHVCKNSKKSNYDDDDDSDDECQNKDKNDLDFN